MSNLPPNPYNNFPGLHHVDAKAGLQTFNHNQPLGQVPVSQLPPGYGGIKQDPNSNSPIHSSGIQNSAVQYVNNYNQSASSSPAFNQSGMSVQHGVQSSPVRPPNSNPLPPSQTAPSSGSPRIGPKSNPSPTPYPPSQQHHGIINDNTPPLIPSSQSSQPLVNGPPMSQPNPVGPPLNQYPPTSKMYSSGKPSVSSAFGPPPSLGPITKPPELSVSNAPQFSAPPLAGPNRNSPLVPGPPVSGPPIGVSSYSGAPNVQQGIPPRQVGINGPYGGGVPAMPPTSEALIGPPRAGGFPPKNGPPLGPNSGLPLAPTGGLPPGPTSGPSLPPTGGPPLGMSGGPPLGPASIPAMRPSSGPPLLQQTGPPLRPSIGQPSGPPLGPPSSNQPIQGYPGQFRNGPSGQPIMPPGPLPGHLGPPPNSFNADQSANLGPQLPPLNVPPVGQQMGPPVGPSIHQGAPVSNMQNRYPQMPPGAYGNNQQPQQANMMKQYPPQYGPQGLTQQMGQLSVTKQGFDQLWGHHMVDLLQCKHILPEYPEDPPEIKLTQQFVDSPNCSPEIFRCTVNRIPETNNLLQKSRLPLGILIHPFKDLNHLPVIQCTTIVRCRACRTYINPFVYFVDAKRWKCNLCYRVNDLPEEFQYDPVSKSYGDPSRRPEIKSATIEFIAPGEYMLRPPQPAVYLFLFDVSQLARESGYLQVACDTLKASLDQLPGDARTQIGFICYDAHVHYYLMSEGLTRPKEMTVLDIDDVFLPSPSSLLVNLGERRELIRELLTALPSRYSSPAPATCALGAALQAAYKLMAPTGGRITVFQTCLPNVGPGALQPREDPNARSSKEVAHLNPATDFYKRLALDCSGAQIAVDLFLLNSQYADLATLSGMSKFSAGTVYHVPLFRASRTWQAEQLQRMFTRYLSRKIGFEAVMRVRCTRGIAIHTFHGNFFVRSTDLLSLPNVSPDAGFGMQLTIEESLSDLQQVCFQAALLYTSSKGERRIRVHTLALPTASNLTDVLHSADQQCIIGLLSKMAVDRCQSASMGEAREAVMNVAVDALSAFRLSQNLPAGQLSAALHAPHELRLLPLYLLALLKRKAFRTGTSTRLDDRVSDMCALKTAALSQLMRSVYPALHAVHDLPAAPRDDADVPDPPLLQLSAERINSNGAYLLDDGETMIIYVCHAVSAAFLSDTLGVCAFNQLPDEQRALPRLHTPGSALLHALLDRLNDERPYPADVIVLRDNSPNRTMFTERLIEDRVESAFSYYEFLQHIKTQVK